MTHTETNRIKKMNNNELFLVLAKARFRELNFQNKIIFGVLSSVHYIKNIINTNVSDWTYSNLVVACIGTIISLWLCIISFAFLLEGGFLWVLTLIGSVFFFRIGNRDTTFGENRFLYKGIAGFCILVSIIIFLAMFV